MKVAICTPTMGSVKTDYMLCLIRLLAQARSSTQLVFATKVTLVQAARHQLYESAKAGGCDYILWIDSDQTFPGDALERLLAHKLPFVGCNITSRQPPVRPVARLGGEVLWTTLDKVRNRAVEPADSIGFGFALTHLSLFDGMEDPFELNDAGEDISFCRRAAARGVRPHVDHALSWEIGHIGDTVYTHQQALAERGANANTVRASIRP